MRSGSGCSATPARWSRGGALPAFRGAAARRAQGGGEGPPGARGGDQAGHGPRGLPRRPPRSGLRRVGAADFGPHARALGLRRKPAEDDEVQLARPKLTEFVARARPGPAARRRGPERWPRSGCRSPARWPPEMVVSGAPDRQSLRWARRAPGAGRAAGPDRGHPRPGLAPRRHRQHPRARAAGRERVPGDLGPAEPEGDRASCSPARRCGAEAGGSAGLRGRRGPGSLAGHGGLLGHPGGAHASRRADSVLRRRRRLVQHRTSGRRRSGCSGPGSRASSADRGGFSASPWSGSTSASTSGRARCRSWSGSSVPRARRGRGPAAERTSGRATPGRALR